MIRSPFLQAIACLVIFAAAFLSGLLGLGLEPLDCTVAGVAGVAATVLFVWSLPAGQGVGPCVPPAADHGYAPNGGRSSDLEFPANTGFSAPRTDSLACPAWETTRPALARADEQRGSSGRGKDLDNHDDRSDSSTDHRTAAEAAAG